MCDFKLLNNRYTNKNLIRASPYLYSVYTNSDFLLQRHYTYEISRLLCLSIDIEVNQQLRLIETIGFLFFEIHYQLERIRHYIATHRDERSRLSVIDRMSYRFFF